MRTIRTTILACALGAGATVLPAAHAQDTPPMTPEQQAMMAAWEQAATPGPEHARLVEQFAGTWDTTISMWMDPAGEPMVERGTSANTAVLGGRHVRMEYSGPFMGQTFEGLGYSGYDNVTGKYHSTWLDNMSTGRHVADGDYDPATRTYTYTGQMHDPMRPEAAVPVRETVQVLDADHHVMEMFETRDGQEARTMRIEFRRAR